MTEINRRTFLGGALGSSLAASASAKSPADAPNPLFYFGLLADAQYADVKPGGSRHYRLSVQRVKDAAKALNKLPLSFSLHLGDVIDRDFASFDDILPAFATFKKPVHHVLGNHDFDVDDSDKKSVPKKLGLSQRHYDFAHHGFRFIVLDGTEVSTFAHPEGTPAHTAGAEALAQLTTEKAVNGKFWNGGVGPRQRTWLEGRLQHARANKERVILCCHYPLQPLEGHALWDTPDMLALIDRYPEVVAWLNGHNHKGNYVLRNGIHYLTVHGVVETADTSAFASVAVFTDRLEITGTDREPSRSLPFHPLPA